MEKLATSIYVLFTHSPNTHAAKQFCALQRSSKIAAAIALKVSKTEVLGQQDC